MLPLQLLGILKEILLCLVFPISVFRFELINDSLKEIDEISYYMKCDDENNDGTHQGQAEHQHSFEIFYHNNHSS